MQPNTPDMPAGAGIIFGIVYFLMMGGMIVAWIFMMVIAWRLMKAHEKLAVKLGEIAEKLQLK